MCGDDVNDDDHEILIWHVAVVRCLFCGRDFLSVMMVVMWWVCSHRRHR